jgi:hypothetical protein
MGQLFPNAIPSASLEELQANSFLTSHSVTLLNGDKCTIGSWVLAKSLSDDLAPPNVYCIQEIVNQKGSANTANQVPDAILLQQIKVQGFAEPYNMPHISLEDTYELLPLQVSFFCFNSFIGLRVLFVT